MFARLRDEERGMAMVVALLVVFVTLILSTYVLEQAVRNSAWSGRTRNRVLAVGAAEAGLNWFYSYLETTGVGELAAAPYATANTARTEALGTAPATSQFSAYATYYDAAGAVMEPSTFSDANYPASASIRSVGTVNGDQPRTMETFVRLTPVYGGFDGAIVSNNGLSLVNNLTLNGYVANDADIYVNSGNATFANQPNIFGSVYVASGNVSLSNATTIRQNLWANGTISLVNSSTILGNATSSTSSITGANSSSIGGNATAGTTISGVAVAGTSAPNTLQGPPPSQAFPQIAWDQADWTDPAKTAPDGPYAVQTFTSCSLAASYLTTGTLTPPAGYGGIVVHVPSVCQISIANNRTISFNGNLAIVTFGSLSNVNRSTWTGVGDQRKLYLIAAYRDGLNCASGSYNVSTSNNTSFANTDVLAYSPCSVTLSNRNAISGQLVGGTVTITNQLTMSYAPLLVPGAGTITGFNESIAYVREVRN